MFVKWRLRLICKKAEVTHMHFEDLSGSMPLIIYLWEELCFQKKSTTDHTYTLTPGITKADS
jgi:hypothetical protein